MKKIIIILISITGFFIASHAYAVTTPTATTAPTKTITGTPTNSPTPSGGNVLQEINSLKDRIASKVAQLNLVAKKGVIGKVTDIGTTQMSIIDRYGNTQFIDVDELTQFSSPSAKSSFGISDITKGSTVGVLGQYNKDSKRILARFIDVLNLPQIISGAVVSIDATNYQITVITPDLKQYIIEIQDITKTLSYTKADGVVRSGFSKIKPGERVFVIGFPDNTQPSNILASRIIRFPELKINPLIPTSKVPTVSITPSIGGGTTVPTTQK